ncbi:hypothetical protein PENTCL1PPCAC_8188 [Pristionchus entomophagus]|uniref:G protein-coupled receptor n=1 Tax=Pristionchus entomophagus TaxID=358040 RepID=A0AAV5SS93_9BILA|nr:hypothetical protein PENTCL1PPCAC_8188 [Pristionchus entomophagus]
MFDSDDIVLAAILSTLDLSAIFVNIAYIWIIRRKTTKALTSYSTLLLNIAYIDILTSFCSLMCIPRVENFSGYVVVVHIGPCTMLSARWCHLVFTGHATFIGLSELFLAISFVYRLWMLRISKTEQQNWIWDAHRIGVVVLTLPTTVNKRLYVDR